MNIKHDTEYLRVLNNVIEHGRFKEPARENMPRTKSLFVESMRFDLRKGFPLLTSKRMFVKGVIGELLWFMSGDTNVKTLDTLGITKFWHQDAYRHWRKLHPGEDADFETWCTELHNTKFSKPEYGDCGPIYGYQWRNFNDSGFDQLATCIKDIVINPTGRYKVVSAWNPAQMSQMALPPCHMLFQFNCQPMTLEERIQIANDSMLVHDGSAECLDAAQVPSMWLDCALTQRSCDMCLGVPINIASYALLTHIVATLTNCVAREFIWTGNDVHIYEHHIDTAKQQLTVDYAASPTLMMHSTYWRKCDKQTIERVGYKKAVDDAIASINIGDFYFEDYAAAPAFKYELFTGLKQ